MIAPAIAPPLVLLPVSAPFESFADVESLMPAVDEAADVDVERPALNGAVVEEDVLDAVLRTGASRTLEEDAAVLEEVVRGAAEEVVVSSSSTVEVTAEERAVVRRAVVLRVLSDVTVLIAVPRPGARVTSSSEAVVSGWPGRFAWQQSKNRVSSELYFRLFFHHMHALCSTSSVLKLSLLSLSFTLSLFAWFNASCLAC